MVQERWTLTSHTNFTTTANHPTILIVRHARKVEPNQITRSGLLQLMKILHPIHLFFFEKMLSSDSTIVVSGDMTGILGGRIYTYQFLVALEETWYTPSSDTVYTSWFWLWPNLEQQRGLQVFYAKKNMQIANLRSSPWWDCSVSSFATSDADPSNQQKRLRCLGWDLPAAKIPGNAWCFARVAVLFCGVYYRWLVGEDYFWKGCQKVWAFGMEIASLKFATSGLQSSIPSSRHTPKLHSNK